MQYIIKTYFLPSFFNIFFNSKFFKYISFLSFLCFAHILKPIAPEITPETSAKEANALVYDWLKSVGVPNKLKDEGFSEADIDRLVDLAFTTPSLGGLLSIAPTDATRDAVKEIYERSL